MSPENKTYQKSSIKPPGSSDSESTEEDPNKNKVLVISKKKAQLKLAKNESLILKR